MVISIDKGQFGVTMETSCGKENPMKQEQVRPVRHQRTNYLPNDTDSGEDLWPLSAREFLKAPSVTAARKSFRYRVDKDIAQERQG